MGICKCGFLKCFAILLNELSRGLTAFRTLLVLSFLRSCIIPLICLEMLPCLVKKKNTTFKLTITKHFSTGRYCCCFKIYFYISLIKLWYIFLHNCKQLIICFFFCLITMCIVLDVSMSPFDCLSNPHEKCKVDNNF